MLSAFSKSHDVRVITRITQITLATAFVVLIVNNLVRQDAVLFLLDFSEISDRSSFWESPVLVSVMAVVMLSLGIAFRLPWRALCRTNRYLAGFVVAFLAAFGCGLVEWITGLDPFVLFAACFGSLLGLRLHQAWNHRRRLKGKWDPYVSLALAYGMVWGSYLIHLGVKPFFGFDRSYYMAAATMMVDAKQFILRTLGTPFDTNIPDMTASSVQSIAAFLSWLCGADMETTAMGMSLAMYPLTALAIYNLMQAFTGGGKMVSLLGTMLIMPILFIEPIMITRIAFNRCMGILACIIALQVTIQVLRQDLRGKDLVLLGLLVGSIANIHIAKFIAFLPFWFVCVAFLSRKPKVVATVAGVAAVAAGVFMVPRLIGSGLTVPGEITVDISERIYFAPHTWKHFQQLALLNGLSGFLLVMMLFGVDLFVRGTPAMRRVRTLLLAAWGVVEATKLIGPKLFPTTPRLTEESVYLVSMLVPALLLSWACLAFSRKHFSASWKIRIPIATAVLGVALFTIYHHQRKFWRSEAFTDRVHKSLYANYFTQEEIEELTTIFAAFKQTHGRKAVVATRANYSLVFRSLFAVHTPTFGAPPHFSFKLRAEAGYLPVMESNFLVSAQDAESIRVWAERLQTDFVVIKIGANTGISNSLAWSKLSPTRRIGRYAVFSKDSWVDPSQDVEVAGTRLFRFRYFPDSNNVRKFHRGPLMHSAKLGSQNLPFNLHGKANVVHAPTYVYVIEDSQLKNWGQPTGNGRRLSAQLDFSKHSVFNTFFNSYPFRISAQNVQTDSSLTISYTDDAKGMLHLDMWRGDSWVELEQVDLHNDRRRKEMVIPQLPSLQQNARYAFVLPNHHKRF